MVENILRNMVAFSCLRIVVLVIFMHPVVFDHVLGLSKTSRPHAHVGSQTSCSIKPTLCRLEMNP
jgi:hypothetical protein